MDTIYALSSGQPPAGIAVVRITGPKALQTLRNISGKAPLPRRATLAALKDGDTLLDNGLTLFFPGPNSATGEDVAELHLHGGRAVVAAVMAALARFDGLRPAEPGEFTRRALEHGRIDLTEAEGLADLLEAETESQRRSALLMAGGALSRQIVGWTGRLLQLAAAVEAVLDFGDEGDVGEGLPAGWAGDLGGLAGEIETMLGRPAAERLKDGVRVVIAGPPNAGKSTLLNALVGREAAITSDVPGTTRDLIEVPMSIAGTPFLLTDSAGLRAAGDVVESIGVERAEAAIGAADIVLWLGEAEQQPDRGGVIAIQAKSDVARETSSGELRVSARTGEGMEQLVGALLERAKALLPREGEVAINARHRAGLGLALSHLAAAQDELDLLILAEELRQARVALDQVTGRAGVEDMLDSLFGRFCIGK